MFKKAKGYFYKQIFKGYKNSMKNKLNLVPGEKIRPECVVFNCPQYAPMLALNNNSEVDNKITCPKMLCVRIRKKDFTCTLTNKKASIYAGAFIDSEFYTYATILNTPVNEEDSPEEIEEVQEIVETKVKKSSVKKKIKAIVKTEEVEEEEEEIKEVTKENYLATLVVEMNSLLDIKNFHSFISKVNDRPNGYRFTNPFVMDLSQASKKISLDDFTTYADLLECMKEYYGNYIVLRAASTCKGCEYSTNKSFSPYCSSCVRNEQLVKMVDIPKSDNFRRK